MARSLPHLKVTKQGFYSYRRRVPDRIRAVLGMREINISLRTTDPKEAVVRHAKAHSETEAKFAEAMKYGQLSEDQLFNAALTKLKSKGVNVGKKKFATDEERDTEFTNRDGVEAILLSEAGFISDAEFAAGYDDNNPAHRKLSVELGILHGSMSEPTPTLRHMFNEWKKDKARGKNTEGAVWKRSALLRERAFELIPEEMQEKEITEITREEAKSYRTLLEDRGYKYETVKKYLAVPKAVVAFAIKERELACPNRFDDLPAVRRADERRVESFSLEEIRLMLSFRDRLNEDAADVLLLLVYTGARLGEISGLSKEDLRLDGDIPHIIIRDNAIRQIKNNSSQRLVPVSGEALDCLRRRSKRLEGAGGKEAVFKRYGFEKGSNTISAAMGKWLRKTVKITNEAKTTHSIRHTMKDLLTEVGTQRDIADMIQGHTAGDASRGYGSSDQLKAKQEALARALALLGVA